LDLGGFTLDGGSVGGNGVVVTTGADPKQSITVRDGSADHWTGAGFQLQSASSLAENLDANHDKDGIVISGGSLTGCTANFNSEYGVNASFTTVSDCNAQTDPTGFMVTDGALSHCVSSGNTTAGIQVKHGTVADCDVEGNHVGILVGENSNVHDNTIELNNADGMDTLGSGAVIEDNVISGNGVTQTSSGVLVQTPSTRVSHNTVSATKGTGILVTASSNLIDDNSVSFSQGVGISVSGTNNTIVKNSAPLSNANGSYVIGPSNNAGPIDFANAASNPWSNTQ
ncbi:MAG: NosD domain-containing protein, partial [Gemmatimonadaceae bacterium]